jgi:hypothetical protein
MRLYTLAALVAASTLSPAWGSENQSVKTCKDITAGFSGSGVAYRGRVVNDDYNMSVVIPTGESGWGGVADNAPFHGFDVFPVGSRASCIIIEVGWRVDEDEKPVRPPGSTMVNVVGTQAWSEHHEGTVRRRRMVNETVSFSAPVRTTFADGQVIMVAPVDEAPKVRKIYQQILKSLSFMEEDPADRSS